ncbi:helix-turn-helix transcriptional regulator [Ramlibacter rhizophilus]|uniref:LuxR family transcriptional regulator n=1 Tax=Ramlibacter rhizophilus TaxID=1781167 RepID=A0A4Z0BEI7_9BURK|nr:LuxR C-terminal-related transcriptional regulator [Ramlibacter rhizophilus]TFY96799.1 LuxR family transcriptional regulator [Ramlibacter rhizophilus]
MQTWHLDPAPTAQPLSAQAVGLLLDAPDRPQPAAALMAFVDSVVPVDYLSLVEYRSARREAVAAPELVEGHARPGMANVTPECFATYRERFWREDAGTQLAQRVDQPRGMAALHVVAEEIHSESWRRDIYERARLRSRLSFFYAPVPGARFAINLYRDVARGDFQPAEIERLLGVAPLLARTHRNVLGGAAARPSHGPQAVAWAESALQRQLPELSPRERAVCARIACGMSADGIACELDIAPSSVLTLRKRAYAKLSARGMHGGRMQLATLVR